MRMGLSGLNSHRKKYNVISSSACDTCGFNSETIIHYLLDCPTYRAARNTLLVTTAPLIAQVITGYNILNIDEFSVLEKRTVCDSFIKGNNLLTVGQNKLLFDAVYVYILETRRFR